MQRRTLLASFAAGAGALPASAVLAAAGSVTTRDSRRLAYIDHGADLPRRERRLRPLEPQAAVQGVLFERR